MDAPTVIGWHADGDTVIVDVREAYEHDHAHIPGAVSVPLSAFDPVAMPDVPEGAKLVLHCAIGVRCEYAAMMLVQAGHPGPIHRIEGGLAAWEAAGGPLESGASRR